MCRILKKLPGGGGGGAAPPPGLCFCLFPRVSCLKWPIFLYSKIWERRKSGKHHHSNSSKSNEEQQRRRSNEIVDIDEMLESPIRHLETKNRGGSPNKKMATMAAMMTSSSSSALEETITLSPRMGSPGN
jgi:hypothetical protein